MSARKKVLDLMNKYPKVQLMLPDVARIGQVKIEEAKNIMDMLVIEGEVEVTYYLPKYNNVLGYTKVRKK